MVICIRHGKTDYNTKATGGEAEAVRGNLDIPLNDEGRQEVYQSAQQLCQYPIEEVRSTPNYLRDTETRHILATVCGAPEVDAPALDPWNVGDLSGKSVDLIWEIISMLMDIPSIPAPNGESYQDFFTKWADYFHQVYAQYGGDDSHAVILVIHGNEFRALPAITEGKPIESYRHQKTKPGQYVVIH